MKVKKSSSAIIVAILFIALVAVFLLQKNTLSSVNRVSEQTALTLLSDNVNQVREVLDNQINNIWARMEIMDSALTAIGDMDSQKAQSYLRTSLLDTYRVELVTEEGEYIDQNGKRGFIKLTEELCPLFLDNSRICTLSQDGERDMVLFGTPITDVTVEGREVQYLMAYYELDTFMNLLSVESFAGNGKIRVINEDGLVLLYTDNLDKDETSYYFFKVYENAKFVESDDISDIDSFRKSVLRGENHAIRVVSEDGKDNIISYAKVHGIDWYVTIVVDYASVLGELDDNIKSIGMSSILATMIVVLLAVILVVFISFDSQKVRNEKQQLEELNQSLEEAKKVTEDALQIAENANKSKSYFLSNISHDIRTPMNAIVGLATLLSNEADNPKKVGEYTKKLSTTSQHLLGLINDVLDMSRIESGETTLNLSEESISSIVDELDQIVRPQMREKGHTFCIDIENIVHDLIIVDKVRLKQICLNLLTNAVKYTQNGGHIKLKMTEYLVSGRSAHYKIEVSDNGYGMDEEFQNNIFDSFTRENDSRISKIQGTGLGMAITKSLVDLMGGTIIVESEKGVGSTFIVDIQFQICRTQDAAQQLEENESGDAAGILKGKKILVAEDNEMNAEIISALLEMYEADFDIYDDGKKVFEAFEVSKPGEYDFILMDVQMPVMNGYEATRSIRACNHENAHSIPIIAMTANAFTEDVQNALSAGMTAHLSKPIDMDALEKTVKEVLSRKDTTI